MDLLEQGTPNGIHPIYMANATYHITNNTIPILMLNPHPFPVKLYQGMSIGHLTLLPPTTNGQIFTHTDFNNLHQPIDQTWIETNAHINPNLSNPDKEAIINVLMEFHTLYATSDRESGHTDLTYHSIPSGNVRPIKQIPRIKAPKEKDVIDQDIQELLPNGV